MKLGSWWTWAIRRFNCSGRTLILTAILMERKALPSCWRRSRGELEGIRRVRFTTSHPRDFGRDIVEVIDAVPTLCDHVHLPVQSGSTRVLEAMQRLYTRDEYLERISWIHAAKRDISLTTDIIVGFPGETERELEETLSLLEEVGYDSAFTFKYSPRPNTPALRLRTPSPMPRRRADWRW